MTEAMPIKRSDTRDRLMRVNESPKIANEVEMKIDPAINVNRL